MVRILEGLTRSLGEEGVTLRNLLWKHSVSAISMWIFADLFLQDIKYICTS